MLATLDDLRAELGRAQKRALHLRLLKSKATDRAQIARLARQIQHALDDVYSIECAIDRETTIDSDF